MALLPAASCGWLLSLLKPCSARDNSTSMVLLRQRMPSKREQLLSVQMEHTALQASLPPVTQGGQAQRQVWPDMLSLACTACWSWLKLGGLDGV